MSGTSDGSRLTGRTVPESRSSRKAQIVLNNLRWHNKPEHLWIIPYVICKWFSRVQDQDDLVTPAYFALRRASRRYNPAHKPAASFSTYAIECVYNGVLSYLQRFPASCGTDDADVDTLPGGNGRLNGLMCREIVAKARLSGIESACVQQYYAEGKYMREIGDAAGMTHEGVRLILRKAIRKMRAVAQRE